MLHCCVALAASLARSWSTELDKHGVSVEWRCVSPQIMMIFCTLRTCRLSQGGRRHCPCHSEARHPYHRARQCPGHSRHTPRSTALRVAPAAPGSPPFCHCPSPCLSPALGWPLPVAPGGSGIHPERIRCSDEGSFTSNRNSDFRQRRFLPPYTPPSGPRGACACSGPGRTRARVQH